MQGMIILRCASFAMLLAGAGCTETPEGEQSAHQTVLLRGLPYRFPREQVGGLINPEEGDKYIRLKPSDGLMLIHDERRDQIQAQRDYTVVAGINDRDFRWDEVKVEDDLPTVKASAASMIAGYRNTAFPVAGRSTAAMQVPGR